MYSWTAAPERLATAAAEVAKARALGRYRGFPRAGLPEPHSGGGPSSMSIGVIPAPSRRVTAWAETPQVYAGSFGSSGRKPGGGVAEVGLGATRAQEIWMRATSTPISAHWCTAS